MQIQTSEGTLNASIHPTRVGIYMYTEQHELIVENMSFLSDGNMNDLDKMIAILESDVTTDSFVISSECLDVNVVSVQGEVMFSILNRCDQDEPEHTVLTAQGKQLLLNLMRRSKGLNKTV